MDKSLMCSFDTFKRNLHTPCSQVSNFGIAYSMKFACQKITQWLFGIFLVIPQQNTIFLKRAFLRSFVVLGLLLADPRLGPGTGLMINQWSELSVGSPGLFLFLPPCQIKPQAIFPDQVSFIELHIFVNLDSWTRLPYQ